MRVSKKSEKAVRVLDVALAKTLLDMGFERRSATNFLLDCGTHTWRVLYRGEYLGIPNSLRETTGMFIPEFEEIWDILWDGKHRMSDPMLGSAHRAHFFETIWGCDYSIQLKKMSDWDDGATFARGLSRWFGFGPEEPDTRQFDQRYPWYFCPKDFADFCIVAEMEEMIGTILHDYWVRLVRPEVERARTLKGFGESLDPAEDFSHAIIKLSLHGVCGTWDRFDRILEEIYRREAMTWDEVMALRLSRGYTEKRRRRDDPEDFNRLIADEMKEDREDADRARFLLRYFGRT